MGLHEYKKKRDFSVTKESVTGKPKEKGKLHFVVQKHQATNLHYDFRLEMGGVLKSWAVPKGPSTDPAIRRLAILVEDHPYDYKDFEGTIPQGEYGGGTVIVWDQGTYEPITEIKGKEARDKYLRHQFYAGSMKIILHGQKLKGEFALVKTHGMGENNWLLIKHKDEFDSSADITQKDESVLSGKTIPVIEKTSEENLKKPVKRIAGLVKKAPETAIPIGMKPMLATLISEPFNGPGWMYEVKWDGYRALAFTLKNGDAQLLSRNNKQFNERFYPIYNLLRNWKIDAVVDGEIVVLNKDGVSSFEALQNWQSEADGKLIYYVFDLIWYNGRDLTNLPLAERRYILEKVLPQENEAIRLSEVHYTDGKEFFKSGQKSGLEGIMAKKISSPYRPDHRSGDWLKLKIRKRQEAVIVGFTKNKDTSRQFSSLLLGVYENGHLQYAGKVGTGFSDKVQEEMMTRFTSLITTREPFTKYPKMKPTWLKPELVCEVAYTEMTQEGVFRHPSFQGLRMDKSAKEVVLEKAVKTKEIVGVPVMNAGLAEILLNGIDDTQVVQVDGIQLNLTHLNKLYWPEDKITKRDMLNYYNQVAEYILPYLKDRPMSLNRFPDGIHGNSFYQKDIKGRSPDWAERFPYRTNEGEEKEYLVCSNKASLLWMASQGCIEMNPWFSRINSPDYPDYCLIDLDPDNNTFDQVIEAALVVKQVLDQIGLQGFCKTSGSTGMHIYIPLAALYTYEQSELFARIIVNLVHRQIPEFTSLERTVSKRKGKMYLDFLQNRSGATVAGPYSLRPKPGATVSMPLHWEELKPGLSMKDFTIFNAVERLKSKGDLFRGVLGKGIDMEKAMKKAKVVFD